MRYTMLLLTALLGAGAFGQNLGEIRGRVLDPDGQPLFLANVYTKVAGELVGTTTDMDGKFVLKPLPPGKNGITISFAGFKTKEMPGVEVVPDRATYIDDQRMAYIDDLGVHEVIGYKRKLIDRDDPSRMSLLASEFEDDPTRKNPIQFISKNFAGVTAAPNGDGLYFRGSRTENTATYLDGIKIPGSVPNIPPSAISSISVYTGGLPARYGDVTGGVIVIETKSYAEVYEERRRMNLASDRMDQ